MSRWLSRLVPAALLLTACATGGPGNAASGGSEAAAPPAEGQAAAVFAGGCFWCMEQPFDQLPGVVSTTSGYTGGTEQAPSYEQVAYSRTSHYEAIRVVYDPALVSYERLLEVFWHNVDPLDDKGQFCDKGPHYRTAIFTNDPAEQALAEQTKAGAAATLGQPVVTPVLPAGTFWEAEDYHQDFYVTNPVRYRSYRTGCGRDRRLQELWGDSAGH